MKAIYNGPSEEDITTGDEFDIRLAIIFKPKGGGVVTRYYDTMEEVEEEWEIDA